MIQTEINKTLFLQCEKLVNHSIFGTFYRFFTLQKGKHFSALPPLQCFDKKIKEKESLSGLIVVVRLSIPLVKMVSIMPICVSFFETIISFGYSLREYLDRFCT